ncbi:MMPL family transporter [Aquabacterium sp. OR-4]|uniref:MMPL family transporter n=1 Tax=Aquabacterium sp. OR-4 TaxID=2978127 RepID=UPI0028C89AE2|nr:MMPL family transporter [Aquabacterium sp. OR-4]MDT7836743.1 MMPL family transporter [Aquabacterium sp. OR-4]
MSAPAASPHPPPGGAALRPRQRALLLAAWLLAMLLGAWVAARSHYSADLSAFLPDRPDARQRLLIEQLQSGIAARSLILGIEGGDAGSRAEASRRLAATLRGSGDFEQVNNGERHGWEGENGAGAWLVQHRYHLSPAVGPGLFEVAGLRDAIDESLSLLGTPAGGLVKPLLHRDPTGETRRLAEALVPAEGPRSEDGVWVSRQAPRAVLLLQTAASGADLDAQAAMLQRVQQAFDQALQRAPALPPQAGLTLKMSGPPVFAVQSRARIETEVHQFAVAGTVLMGALLLLAFGSLPALAVAFLPVLTGVLGGVAAVSLGFGTVHGMTLGFGSTLIGEAVDYAIYYLIQARGPAGTAPGTGFRLWQRASWPTVRLGLLTSVCGFAALLFSGFPGLAQLGVFSVAGLLAAALTARWVLPALMPDGAAGSGLRGPLGRGAVRVVARLPALRLPLAALAAAALALLLWQRGTLWAGDLASLSPVPRAAMALDAQLRADLSADDERTLVAVPGADLQATLRAAETVGARLDAWVADGRLASYDSPARLLPSLAAQQARLASLPPPELLRARLAEAQAGSPLPAARLEPFVAEVDAARRLPAVERQALAGSPLKAGLDAMLMQRDAAHGGGWLALLSLHPGATPADAASLHRVLDGVPGAQVLDLKLELDRLYARYLREAMWQSALGAAAVVVLLALALRSAPRLLRVCVPLALTLLITLGGLALAGTTLGILHLVGLLLVVAVGSNYALFFDQFARLPAAAPPADTLASLLLANLTTVGSFALIAQSQIPALAAIGEVVAPGTLLALLLSAAFITPAPAARPQGG